MSFDHNPLRHPQGSRLGAGTSSTPFGAVKSPGFMLVRNLLQLVSRLRGAVIREYRLRRDIRHVSQLDRRMLNDIGLEPDQYMDALRYGRDGFWRN